MGRISLRTAAVVTLAALFTATAATASYGAVPAGEVNPPTPIDLPSGQYIVLLDEAPAATYDGGEAGLAPTQPKDGDKLDPQSKAVKKYVGFLEDRQQEVAADAGVTTKESYQLTVNGFSAHLSADQAAKLSATEGVLGVFPDEIKHPDAVPSTDYLGLSGADGVWEKIGGIPNAGKGVVVGVVDTGIAPENPSFAGEPLSTTPSDTVPYLDGNDVVFHKADGETFRSTRVAGQQWNDDDYSTKIVGAKYFSSGAAATGFDFQYDFLSPRDGAGHGSHTASTAAGNNDVAASVQGVDFGRISGVAPAAKVAAYKACYDGPDPLETTDDICASSDLLAAIEAAVDDKVDVINYSIGGGAATTVLSADDYAFLGAAAAGVFVAVSAGNDGPGASTADHASPWYTTVAASTIPTYEGTVVLGDGFKAPGDTVSVPFGTSVTAPVIYAGDVGTGPDAATSHLCVPGSIDPTQVTGKIVVCDRGTNARIEKSQVVKDAGGVGMILVNVTPSSLDNDFHAVPTVHISNIYRDTLLTYVRGTAGATATLESENTTGIETPVPQVAGFSSRGPDLADGSDVLKPDITGPGVAILAATNNPEGSPSTWGFLSGTSMSSPHIAGLAALYLGVHPNAAPSEVKSALMTTAYDTKYEDGSTDTDPFDQGAGQVDPTRYLSPGLVYLNGLPDWLSFLKGKGFDFEASPIDGSDLNLASIAVGSLPKPQTVTRTVTALEPGTYAASIDVPGIDAVVSPSTLTFVNAGDTATFTVTFNRTTAPVEQWATGFLTWTSDATSVRSPVAVQPVTADAPAEVAGVGITGSTDVHVTPGLTGSLPLTVNGLAPITLLTDPDNPVPGHTGDEKSGDKDHDVTWIVNVPEGTTTSRFTLDTSESEGADLDLYVYRIVSPTDSTYYQVWQSATGSADEQVTLQDPTPGTYLVRANLFAVPNPLTFDATYANVLPTGEGALTATPNPLEATQGVETSFALSWTGLQPNTRYLGSVQYGESAVRTLLTVDAGAPAPVATVAPKITGTPAVGKKLTATPGTWDPSTVTVAYQWLRDGQPIRGATGTTYTVTKADVGTKLSVRVTATAEGSVNTGVATSNELFVKFTSYTAVSLNRYLGTQTQDYAVTASVVPSGGPAATGAVGVRIDSKNYTGTLVNGVVTVPLPKQSRGIHIVIVTYAGNDTIGASTGLSAFIVWR